MGDEPLPKWMTLNPNDEKALAKGYYYDSVQAERIIKFSKLVIMEDGEPIELLEWELSFLRKLYGFKRPDGSPRWTEVFLFIPKSNGKSSLAALCGLFEMLDPDGNPAPSVLISACDKEQATIIYQMAYDMLKRSPKLRYTDDGKDRIHPTASKQKLYYPKRQGRLQSLSKQKDKLHGLRSTMLLFDEICALSDRATHDNLKWSLKNVKNPLTIYLSTAGFDMLGIGKEKVDYAKAVHDGKVEDLHFLPELYFANEGDDLNSEETWLRCNPSLGSKFYPLHQFREEYNKAKFSSASLLAFKRLKFNIFTEVSTEYIPIERFNQCVVKGLTIPPGSPIVVGVDMSNVVDLTAICACANVGGKILTQFWAFVPTAFRERQPQNELKYQGFAQAGELKLTHGNARDDKAIKDVIYSLAQTHKIKTLIFEEWDAYSMEQEFMAKRFNVMTFPANMSRYTDPTKRLEQYILRQQIAFPENSLLKWCFQNCSIKQSNDGKKCMPWKETDANKIDLVSACVIALSQISLGDAKPTSIYNTRKMVTT